MNPASGRQMDTNTSADTSGDLAQLLAEKVVGQPHAFKSIIPYIDMYRSGLAPEGRPAGIFLLLGPTGTGKTKTVEALACVLHGSEKQVLRINCGEFQMEHEVAKLIGAPPGYLGHRETQPMLTEQKLEAVTSDGCSLAIVLFDEIEKAAPSLNRLLLGVLDKATLRLGDNTEVDFENTLIFLTSNLGAREMMKEINPDFGFQSAVGAADNTDLQQKLQHVAMSAVRRKFSPEFVNRIDAVITYQPLDEEALSAIVDRQVDELQQHVNTRLGGSCFTVDVSPESRQFLLRKGTSKEYGARELKRTVHKYLTQPLATLVASLRIKPGTVVRVGVAVDGESLVLESTGDMIEIPGGGGRPIVLLVDDNRDLLRLFELALSRKPWTILTADTGADAQAILSRQTPDVIVFDYLLPDSNGVQLAAEILSMHPRIEIIIATGGELSARDHAACERHNFPVLRKPFLADDLAQMITGRLNEGAAIAAE
jgi:ATP-dependent Clp protease ATP-binding subunit ClpA/ActR/RegA family two-component response regulator